MAYCIYGDVRNILHTSLIDANITAMIVLADARVDQMLGGTALSADLLKLMSMMVTASFIGPKDPSSYAIGLARVQYGTRPNWMRQAQDIVDAEKAKTASNKIKSSEYRKINEDLRYPA